MSQTREEWIKTNSPSTDREGDLRQQILDFANIPRERHPWADARAVLKILMDAPNVQTKLDEMAELERMVHDGNIQAWMQNAMWACNTTGSFRNFVARIRRGETPADWWPNRPGDDASNVIEVETGKPIEIAPITEK